MSNDVGASVRGLVTAGTPGALIQIEPRTASLIAWRAGGADRTAEGTLLDRAWERVHGRLPDGTVLRRAGRTAYDGVLTGERTALIATARGLVASLVADPELAHLLWQVVLVRITDDADRVLMCDWSYDVAAAPPGDVIAWVEPYAGADWRSSGRMPTVSLEPTLSTRR
jgi:hypothetical protein